MEVLCILAFILAKLSENAVQTLYSEEPPPTVYRSLAAIQAPRLTCHYLYLQGWRIGLRNFEDGTPCWYSRWYSRVGYCFRGRCTIKAEPLEIPCDGVRRSPGYATSCYYRCTKGFQTLNMPYNNRTPCLLIGQSGRPAGGAGICMSGMCKPSYDLSPEEVKLAHPPALVRCPEREHTGRGILTSCYYYCRRNGDWYSGYFDSKPTSGCMMQHPARGQPLGWCCRGSCSRKYNCAQL
ncbi:uncharacterized protein LOC119402043 [Rhipicephalus sanguineus]|uniref:uncharacterized protein LOC119402043 n=1 Tax=Rhipicephalus sanguineus TaxID=34632 RepID=UPI00189430F3|nr:uncharacterized protein LOC119402043 [Rhipicephalus sanguineus]